jgi:Putative metallopeptidase
MSADRVLAAAVCATLSIAPAAAAADAQAGRIQIEYQQPGNPAHQPLYELIKQRRVLEKLQEIFGPFRLPMELTIRTIGCDGRANAWYQRPFLTLCYEYLEEIRQNAPKETTPLGLTASDAVAGQFFYVAAHEFGHAVFDLLAVPSFGGAEDAADQFSAYLMLHVGKDEARRMVLGAAYSYRNVLQSSTVVLPLKAFSDLHGVPAQRFYNLLCVAYGADPQVFADAVEKGYLPQTRAPGCAREYGQVAFAFQQLIAPHIDKELAAKVHKKAWLPEAAPGR